MAVVDQILQVWELWYPEAGATGLPFARCRLDRTTVLWVHAAPPVLAVTVRESGAVVARERQDAPLRLAGTRTPMTRLSISDGILAREDRWPGPDDFGAPVVLHGGEAGLLTAWWNAPDYSEWRWTLEFYNRA